MTTPFKARECPKCQDPGPLDVASGVCQRCHSLVERREYPTGLGANTVREGGISSLEDWNEQTGTRSASGNVATPARAREQLFVRLAIGGNLIPIDSLKAARDKWVDYRDRAGRGVSELGNGLVVLDAAGKEVGSISYNGRIWPTTQDLDTRSRSKRDRAVEQQSQGKKKR